MANPIPDVRVQIHSATNGDVNTQLPVQPVYLGIVAWGPGNLIALTTPDALEIWDADTLELVETISANVNNLTWRSTGEITYSDDSRSVITIIPDSVTAIENASDTTPTATSVPSP